MVLSTRTTRGAPSKLGLEKYSPLRPRWPSAVESAGDGMTFLWPEKIHSRSIGDLSRCELLADAIKGGSRMRGRAAVVAMQHANGFSERTNDCNIFYVWH